MIAQRTLEHSPQVHAFMQARNRTQTTLILRGQNRFPSQFSANHIQFRIAKLRFCIANCDAIPDKFIPALCVTSRPLPKMLFFFFKKCFWHCSLSSQKMLKISRDSLKNAFSHFLSRLKIRSNKQMIKDQDTGMGGACYPISGKGKRTRPYYTSNIKESEHTTTTTTLRALFSRT